MTRWLLAVGMGWLLATSVARAEGMPESATEPAVTPTHRYLVTTTHTPDQCLAALDEMAAKGKKALSKMQWGCKAGDHTGYAFVNAADENAALAMLPPSSRAHAKAVEVTSFTPRQIKKLHAKQAQK